MLELYLQRVSTIILRCKIIKLWDILQPRTSSGMSLDEIRNLGWVWIQRGGWVQKGPCTQRRHLYNNRHRKIILFYQNGLKEYVKYDKFYCQYRKLIEVEFLTISIIFHEICKLNVFYHLILGWIQRATTSFLQNWRYSI